MSKKRDRLQIIHDILKAIASRNGRIKPTHILYRSNISHQMLEDNLKEMMAKGFITEHVLGQGKTYSLAPKGFEYLNKYKLIIEFTESFGLNEDDE